MEAAPALNTRFDGASHAHPPPLTPPPGAVAEQRLRSILARHPVAVKLHGLPYERASTVSDILMPMIRRSPVNSDVNPNHLDVTECWKGLSHTQATELMMWSHFFRKCMHDEVRTSLVQALIDDLLRGEEPIDELFILPRITEFLRQQHRRVIEVSFINIIDSMMGMFHDLFPNEAASVASKWSHFSGGLSRFLHNFLRVQDCFCESASGPCLEVEFKYQYNESILTATGVVAWQTPGVRFLPLKHTISPGQEYRITPFILSDALDSVHSLGSDHYADQTTYTISQSPFDFSYCATKRCFTSTAPDLGDDQSHTLETVLTASIVTPFPDGVKYERQSRWSIKLTVSPAVAPKCFGAACPLEPQHIGDDSWNSKCLSPRLVPIPSRVRNSVRSTEPSEHPAEILSTQKRKVPRPEINVEASEHKRRCFDSRDENRKNLSINTQFSGQGHVFGLVDDINAVLDVQKGRRDSGCWSPGTPPRDLKSSPISTVTGAELDLEQQRYRRNYHEFADRKLFKDMGFLVSPVSEGESQAYARIFMDDSELCSSITDESAMELDASDE